MRYAILLTMAIAVGALVFISQSPAAAIEFDAKETPTGKAAPAFAQQSGGDEPDILLMVLLTVGAAGAAAVVSLVGYVIRQRVGFWLHRPPRDSTAPEDHH